MNHSMRIKVVIAGTAASQPCAFITQGAIRIAEFFSLVFVLLICCASATGQTVSSAAPRSSLPTVADWRNDIDAIVGDVRLLHPNPFTKTGKLTFMREAEAFK